MPFEPAIQLHLKMSYSLSLRWSRGLSSHYTQQKGRSGYCEAVWQVDCGEVEWWSLLNSSSLRVDGLSNLCQVDGQMNVGETQMNKFSSNRPVKSTLTARQSLLKQTLKVSAGLVNSTSVTAVETDIHVHPVYLQHMYTYNQVIKI